MTSRTLFGFLAIGILGVAAACSDDPETPAGATSSSSGGTSSSSGNASSSSGSASSSSGNASSSSGNVDGALSGTIGGKAFTFKSGFFFKQPNGTIDLVFSDKDGACDDAKEKKLPAGVALVQFYALGKKGAGLDPDPAEVGSVTSSDMKYALVEAACPSGGLVEENVEKSGRANDDSVVTLTALTDTNAEGSFDVTFDDGSTLKGSFEVASCSTEVPDGLTCR